jgi:hypothetical protein
LVVTRIYHIVIANRVAKASQIVITNGTNLHERLMAQNQCLDRILGWEEVLRAV